MSQEENQSELFKSAKSGSVITLPVTEIKPTQPDDGRKALTTGPIEAYVDEDEIRVLNGNHRFWDLLRRGPGKRKIAAKKVENPHK